jgi:hypothetical protein
VRIKAASSKEQRVQRAATHGIANDGRVKAPLHACSPAFDCETPYLLARRTIGRWTSWPAASIWWMLGAVRVKGSRGYTQKRKLCELLLTE